MVQQMSEANSLDDARQRATQVFVAAEQAMLQSAAAKVHLCFCFNICGAVQASA